MKNYYLRSCVALACALSMTACGGSDNDMVLYVSVYGVTMTGMTLTNNDGPPLAVEPGTSIAQFPALVGADSNYEVKVKSPPNATCVVNNGKGKTGSYSPNNITVVCTAFTYHLGGTIKNLTGKGLILVNGSTSKTFDAVAGTTELAFDMSTLVTPAVAATATTPEIPATYTGKVPEGIPYGVLIYRQPDTGTCSIDTAGAPPVSTGIGIVPHGDVNTIKITCVN